MKTHPIMPGLPFPAKMRWRSYKVSITKTGSKKIGALICSKIFFRLRLYGASINLLCDLAWNTVLMNCCYLNIGKSYKNENVGLLIIHLTPCLVVKM